jgi:hypothetical protein
MAAAARIMIVRHAEKPSDDGTILGVDATGGQNPEELIVRGRQRSGALVHQFAPRNGAFVDPHLATPKTIFASEVAKHSESLRPRHTVLELATVLGLTVSFGRVKDDLEGLVDDALEAVDPVLIAWEHQDIPDMREVPATHAVPERKRAKGAASALAGGARPPIGPNAVRTIRSRPGRARPPASIRRA